MLKLSDLAERPDFQLGPLRISPSRRLVEGPGGKAHVEPIIMQVFLLLLDARGQVVTRAELFDQVWGGVMVGDDSLNRAIAKVRKIASVAAPGLFEIETVPRTGYRLIGEFGEGRADLEPGRTGLARRMVIAGGLATAAAGGAAYWFARSREDRAFEALIDRGTAVLKYNDPAASAVDHFRKAASLRPDSAQAQGLLAYALAFRAETDQPEGGGVAVSEADKSTRTALSLDQSDPHARLAAIILQRSMLDFVETEARLDRILHDNPNNTHVMRHLWNLMACVGRSRDALTLVDRALAVEPLAAGHHYPKAQLLWILGRTAEADRVIDRATQYWPAHRFVRFAQFTILAFTGRAKAAAAMLDDPQSRPRNFSQAGIDLWRINLSALDSRSQPAIAAAREANLHAAKQNLRIASQAVLTMSVLGELDAAFEIANALFAVHGSESVQSRGRKPVKGTAWRFAPWLFTPPTAALRADPRFKLICDEAGLSDYWARRGIEPDYRLATA